MDRMYAVYETHQLWMDAENKNSVMALYIRLEKNVSGNNISPGVDMSLCWLPSRFGKEQFKRVPFYPPDVVPEQHGIRVDASSIPQRTPIWKLVRGPVSGTKAYKLMGYWVPTKKEDPTWSYTAEPVFNEFSKQNMRFGNASEDFAIMMMLLHAPNVKIELVGWCKGVGVPVGWGASPDGIIHNKEVVVPESIQKHFVDTAPFDYTRGVLEIKSSQTSLALAPYYFPQVYMEMISTNTVWCDLVRYRRCRPHANATEYVHEARVFRIFRHRPTEESLVRLLKYALNNTHRLQDVVQEAPFVALRAHFKELSEITSYREIKFTPEMRIAFDAYNEHSGLLCVRDNRN